MFILHWEHISTGITGHGQYIHHNDPKDLIHELNSRYSGVIIHWSQSISPRL